MGQTEEFRMMSRPNRNVYTPITRGHKPTASQESNTLSEVSCTTTLSGASTDSGAVDTERADHDRLSDFREEEEHSSGMGWRSGSEETVDTVVNAASRTTSNLDKR